jgi:ankyrin repeat protein
MNNGSFFEGSVVDMETPLGIAMSYYHKNAARVLIMNGADVNKGNDHGSTPLHSAATGGFVDMVQLLIEHGANVNAEEPGSHWTPLQAAATMGHKDVMGILISHGADGNVRNWTGKTAADMLEEHNKTQEYLKSHK